MYEYKCEITKVIDGDTLDINIDLGFDVILRNQRVRLNGIDTPESRTTDKVEKIFGLLAKQKVHDFVDNKVTVLRTETYDSTGKFGRILGDIIVDGESLCEMLINNHYAVHYHGQSKDDIQDEHLKNREILTESGEVQL